MGLNGLTILGESPNTITVMGPDGQRREIDKASLDPGVARELAGRSAPNALNTVPPVFTPDPNQTGPSILSRIGDVARQWGGNGGGFGTGITPVAAPRQAPVVAAAPVLQQQAIPQAPVQPQALTAPQRRMAPQPTTPAMAQAPTERSPGSVRDLGIGPDEQRVQGAMDEVAEARQRGLEDQAYVQDKIGLVQQDRQAMIADYQQRQADFEKQRQGQIKADTDRIAALQKEYQETKIRDPWADKSTGTKIVSAIAVGLGAWGAAMANTPNYALEIINQGIENDLQKQRMILDQKRNSIQDSRLLLAQTQKEFSDRSAAMQAAHITALGGVSAQLEEYANESKSAQYRTNAQELLRMNELNKAERIEALHAAQAKAMATANAREVSIRSKQAQDEYVTLQQRSGLTTPEEITRQKQWDQVVNIGGEQYLAPTTKEAVGYKEGLMSLNQYNRKLDEAIAYLEQSSMLDRVGNRVYTGEDAAKIESIMSVAAQNRPKIYDPTGVIRDQDIHLSREILGEPTKELNSTRAIARLQEEKRAAMERVNQYKANMLRVTGGRNAEPRTAALLGDL